MKINQGLHLLLLESSNQVRHIHLVQPSSSLGCNPPFVFIQKYAHERLFFSEQIFCFLCDAWFRCSTQSSQSRLTCCFNSGVPTSSVGFMANNDDDAVDSVDVLLATDLIEKAGRTPTRDLCRNFDVLGDTDTCILQAEYLALRRHCSTIATSRSG